MDKVEVLQDINARLQMKMTLNADQAMARESALKSRIAYLEDTALPHARKQEHANGFQAGWRAALTRIEQGDGVEELLDACPTVLPNQDCVIHLPRPDCQIGHAHIIDACGAFEPQAAVRHSGEPSQTVEEAKKALTHSIRWLDGDRHAITLKLIDALIAAVRAAPLASSSGLQEQDGGTSLTAGDSVSGSVPAPQLSHVGTSADGIQRHMPPEGFWPTGTLVHQSEPAQEWEPSGKCQYDGCDGTRFAYDSGEVPGYGTFYCVKCHGAQIPLIPPQQAASGYSPRESPAPPLPSERLLRDFANAVKELASKGYRHLDADEESKAMKVLSALAGVPGCYPEIDKLYARIESGR